MRTLMIATLAMVGFQLGTSDSAEAKTAQKDVENAVRTYVSAGDTRDVDAIERIVHPNFRVVVAMGNATSVMSKDDYVGLTKAEKIGGIPRECRIEWVRFAGPLAFAKANLESKAASFDALYTLAKGEDGSWRIMSDAVNFVKKG